MNKRAILCGFLIVLGGVFSACQRKSTRWDAGVAVPLFRSDLSLQKINHANLINSSADTSFNLIYDQLVYSGKLSNVRTPDTSINTSFTLKKLKLSDRTITQKISLGQINPLFKLLDGQTTTVPAQDQSDLSPVDIDASAFFETATLDSGFLDVSIHNELPVKIKLVIFQITNANDGSFVASDSFLDIDQNQTQTKQINLRNKTVNKSLKGTIKKLVTEASSGPVLIDANKGVEVILSVSKLRPRSAIAAFPNQTVVDQDAGLVLDMGGPEVKYFKAKSGNLRVRIESTIQENMTMYFAIPSATINGIMLERTIKLPGSVGGKTEIRETVVPMAGYLLDFRGKNPSVKDTVNTFHQILKVSLDSSGRKVQVTLNDSIRIFYQMEEMEPEYAIGYMGKSKNVTGPATSTFDLFKGLDGDLQLKNFTASILFRNSVGAEGRLKVNSLEGENIFNHKKVKLSATPLSSDIFIGPPSFVYGNYTEKNIVLDQTNSNIKNFIELLPQLIHYDLEIETNPNGNVNNWTDFIFSNSSADVFLRLETPATFGITGLNLRDTQAIDFATLNNFERVKSVKLIIDAYNDYPFDVGLELSFLDAGFNLLGIADIGSDQKILAGRVAANGQPLSNTHSKIVVTIPRDKMDMLRQAKNVVIKAKIAGAGNKQKIYNSWKLKISTSGQFEYEGKI